MACLNECMYYDEIAANFTRLLHESRDYIATLKHYKLLVPDNVDLAGVLTFEHIQILVGETINSLCAGGTSTSGAGNTSGNQIPIKLKPKLIESLEERRRALDASATTTAAQQQALHIMSTAALAGAATMLHCLPQSTEPLNPLVKPLMESIKREENEELQKLAAKHLAYLVDLFVDRKPSPNKKVCTRNKQIC